MEDIIEPTMDYDFSKLYFGPPTTLAGGAYFARLMHNTNKSLFIQTPKSLTKQGFIKSGKKIYTDLMFDNNDTVFINWIENLESRCQELIYSKRESWFESNLEKDDIESAFTSSFKIFKSGKHYLLRVNVKPNIKIYDEKDQITSIEDITNTKTIVSILEIQGIKFTSRNFQIEIDLRQSMLVSPDPFLETCFIKKPIKTQPTIKYEPEKESVLNNLDELINSSVKDLKNSQTNINNQIDLEVSFEKNNLEENKNKHTLDLEEANIQLDIEDLEPTKDNPNMLIEIDLSSTLDNSLETLQLKKHNQVYYDIYKKAREKAKEAKKNAIVAYLEMKNIKKTYMLDDIDESESDFDEFVSKDNSSEISDTESLENTLDK
jgi:hypothetical protein